MFFRLVATLAHSRVLVNTFDQVPNIQNIATRANVGARKASRETWKNMGKSCWNRLELIQTAWLMCVIAQRRTAFTAQ